jgi:hypothetical protein
VNYFFKDIDDPHIQYPDSKNPEIASRFMTMDEYHTIAKKVIKRFGKEYAGAARLNEMVNSDDYVSEVATQLMMADWRYDTSKGCTPYSYRNQCGKWAVLDVLGLSRTRANQPRQSLDVLVGDAGDSVSIASLTEDLQAPNPSDDMKRREKESRIRKYVKFLLKTSRLTDVQAKCLQLRYFGGPYGDGIESHAEIGQYFNPPITRQAVKQSLDKALFRLRQTAKGTDI